MNRKRMRSRTKRQIILIAVLSCIGVIMLVPIIWMISLSFDRTTLQNFSYPPSLIPKEWSMMGYKVATRNIPMLKYLSNSLIISSGVVVISVLSAASSGYALSKIPFKGKSVILVLMLCTMMVPLETTMIPQFQLFSKLNLINSYFAFYLPSVVYVFGTFFAKQYIDSIYDSFRESALLDGANEWTIAFRIYLPLCRSMLASLGVLVFLNSWNDFLWPLIVLNQREKFTIQIGISMLTQGQGGVPMPGPQMAATALSVIPVFILYIFAQNFILESIATSGVKE